MINKLYIRFDNTAKINYYYLLLLLTKAEYNKSTGRYDTIHFGALSVLYNKTFAASSISISKKTFDRFIANKEYSKYFTVDKKNGIVSIHNDFTSSNERFVVLTSEEYNKLLPLGDSNIILLYMYHKAFRKHDSTLEQILSYLNFSHKSNSNKSNFTAYHKKLVELGLLKICHFRDDNGKLRVSYSTLV